MTDEGFVHTAHRVQPLVIDDIAEIIPGIMAQAAEIASVDSDGEDAVISKM
jgi:hypothetical protein